MNASMLQRLGNIEDLPTLPEIIQEISAALSEPNVSVNHIADLISRDPVISGKVLRLVNSAFYSAIGSNGQITTLPHAVARLGLTEVRNLVFTMSLFSTFPKLWKTIHRNEFWKHCLTVANTTRALYENYGRREEDVEETGEAHYIAGLLHDLGIVVQEQYFHSEFSLVLSESRTDEVPLHEIEEKRWGIDHGAMGAHLARVWKIPDDIAEAIEFHHRPDLAKENALQITRVVHFADHICSKQGVGMNMGIPVPECNPECMMDVGFDVNDPEAFESIVSEELDRTNAILTLAA